MGVVRVNDAPSGAAVFEVTGENDAYDADRLARALDAVRPAPALIDLRSATFVDSTFVGMLLQTHAQSTIAIVIPTDAHNPIARVFALTHLAEALPVFEDRDQALATL